MPAPGAGGVQTSLVGTVQSMMARARNAFGRKPGPTPGAPIKSPGENPPDLTQFSDTFEPSGGLFAPGYPLPPVEPERLRALDYPVGYNYIYTPRSYEPIGFAELRSLAQNHDITRLCIETRKDQIEALQWTIKPRDERNPKAGAEKRADALAEFWMCPDGNNDFATWLRIFLEDVLVLDAGTLEVRKNRGGDIIGLDIIDGSTIKVLIDTTGRRPAPPAPAFEQIIHGRPWTLTEDGRVSTNAKPDRSVFADQLIYVPRNPRPHKLYGFCFSPDTEMLTAKGWKRVGTLGFEDSIATRHPESRAFQWQSPIALTSRPYKGQLINFTAQNLDVLVTPEHRMIVRNRRGDERLIPAAELAASPHWRAHFQIPVSCESWAGIEIGEKRFGTQQRIRQRNKAIKQLRATGGTYSEISERIGCSVGTIADVLTERYCYDGTMGGRHGADTVMSGDDYCAFMGMYLSEGSINKNRIVVISQSQTSPHWEKFKGALAKIFGPISYEKSDFLIYRTHVARHLKPFGHSHQKFIPADIMNAPPAQIRTFLEFLFDGDAHRSRKGTIFHYTTSRKLADQLQELAQKIGRSANIRPLPLRSGTLPNGRVITSKRPQYRVSIGVRKHLSAKPSFVDFDGTVFCVSVPNQSVYVRRNGLAAWTSQSPVEQILLTINIGIRRQIMQLQHFTEGNVPPGMATGAKDWSPDQTAKYQEWFDSYLSGNTGNRTKMIWGPAEAKYIPFKEAPYKDDFDEWLTRIVCYAFSLPPSWAVKQMNRATASTAQEVAIEEGLAPIMGYVKRLIDNVIQRRMGHPDLEFSWHDERPIDPADQAKIFDTYIKNGTYVQDEVRDKLGEDPLPNGVGSQPMIVTASGPVLLKNLEALGELSLNPPQPTLTPSSGAAAGEGAPGERPAPPKKGGAGNSGKGKANGKTAASDGRPLGKYEGTRFGRDQGYTQPSAPRGHEAVLAAAARLAARAGGPSSEGTRATD